MVISPPFSASDIDRGFECEVALEHAIAEIESVAVEAGWSRIEVAIALVDLGKARIREILECAEIDVLAAMLPH